jgi:hypothetical protein
MPLREGKGMERWRVRQPNLFEVRAPRVELSEVQRNKALALLGFLLTEAIATSGEEEKAEESREVDIDQDHC